MQVPDWWIWLSGAYVLVSLLWTIGLCVGLLVLYNKTMPVLKEARTQVRRVSDQAKSLASKASHTADIVHSQTQHLLGTAQSAGNQMTQSARALGAGFTGLIVAARVVNFVRKFL
ncbi:MAG TPA: hypothetical protein VFB21_05810 [Chthonomonadaceae bacterium]|nr:hypothetical protein [Chthonomonadaceae bacterium]